MRTHKAKETALVRAMDVGIGHPDTVSLGSQPGSQVSRHGAFAHAALIGHYQNNLADMRQSRFDQQFFVARFIEPAFGFLWTELTGMPAPAIGLFAMGLEGFETNRFDLHSGLRLNVDKYPAHIEDLIAVAMPFVALPQRKGNRHGSALQTNLIFARHVERPR